MTKWNDHSPEVPSQEENGTEIKAAELFTNGVALNEARQKAIRKACRIAYSPFSKKGLISIDDLVQEVTLKILKAPNPYRSDKKLPGFAWRIATNYLINLTKTKHPMNAAELKVKHTSCRESEERSEAEILDNMNPDVREINRNYQEDHELRMIATREFFAQLTAFQQLVLQLLDQGYDLTEIAAMRRVTPQAISRCRDRINRKLRIYLRIPQKSFVKSP